MTDKVHICDIKLDNFRNYDSLKLDIDPRHVVLTGENGSGKTNLMEAVSLLTPGRGLRRSNYNELPKANSNSAFTVFARLEGMLGEANIGTGISPDEPGSRKIRINGINAKANDELLDHARILWLTPSMDGLFSGGAGDRRRFLDRLVLAVDPTHGKRSSSYERAMRSRNKLLTDGNHDPVWLDGIEEQMAELGIAIASARQDFIQMLVGLINDDGDEVNFPRAMLALEGFDIASIDEPSVEKEQRFLDELKRNRPLDMAAGRSTIGPHKTDLIVFHNVKNMPASSCSTGEQKALLVGLVLAHARLVKNLTGFAPILLLDEIAAHLDERRRGALFDLIEALNCQAFMTGTDHLMFGSLGDRAQYFNVADGTLTEIS